jgi:hypothetical protein
MVTAEHAALLVPRGTAYTIPDYAALCRRALHDEAWAEALAAEQAELASRVGDPRSFWRQVLDAYALWLNARPADAAASAAPVGSGAA